MSFLGIVLLVVVVAFAILQVFGFINDIKVRKKRKASENKEINSEDLK